jgi:pyrroline-5-carboxylate reductase
MRLAIVGVGNLGGALAERLLVSGFCRDDLAVVTRGSESSLKRCEKLGLDPQKMTDLSFFDAIILTVKPQDTAAICAEIRGILRSETLVVSLMAGIPTARIRDLLDHSLVARAMPNLGTVVGHSATAYFAPGDISEAQRLFLQRIFGACGRSFQVADESLLDLATAVAGSGPAYLCWLGEQLESVALDEGFSRADAHAVVLQTFKGAVAYLEQSGESFAALRAKVTSPQGTTAAAIKTLSDHDTEEIVKSAVRAALDRARELGR